MARPSWFWNRRTRRLTSIRSSWFPCAPRRWDSAFRRSVLLGHVAGSAKWEPQVDKSLPHSRESHFSVLHVTPATPRIGWGHSSTRSSLPRPQLGQIGRRSFSSGTASGRCVSWIILISCYASTTSVRCASNGKARAPSHGSAGLCPLELRGPERRGGWRAPSEREPPSETTVPCQSFHCANPDRLQQVQGRRFDLAGVGSSSSAFPLVFLSDRKPRDRRLPAP